MSICDDHSHKSGKRCTLEEKHFENHIFVISCICGSTFCAGRNRRILRKVGQAPSNYLGVARIESVHKVIHTANLSRLLVYA